MTTQHVFASYQEIIDLHTEDSKVSILGFHTPCNMEPVRLLRPFWDAYQRVRYRGCSMTMVPAARLPADPMGVSYEAGEQQIDPRDLLNPILFHGCHGNDMSTILNQFYSGEGSTSDIKRMFSDSMDHNMVSNTQYGNGALYESLYYRALTDNTWLKAHPQRGFRKSMRPMVYTLATNTPLNPSYNGNRNGTIAQADPDNGVGVDDGVRTTESAGVIGGPSSSGTSSVVMSGAPGLQKTNSSSTVTVTNPLTYSGQFFMSPSLRPLGFIDTRQWVTGYQPSSTATADPAETAVNMATAYAAADAMPTYIPKLFMGMVLLPPAYKTEQYFRIILNHKFEFAKYRGTSMRNNGQLASVGNVVNMYGDDTKGDDDGFGDKGILYD